MKLFASIVTTGKFRANRDQACLDTWLPKFDGYLFCTDTKSDDHCFVVTDRTDYGSCKGKQLAGFRICEEQFGDCDWYFACGPDTCVNVDNLRYLCNNLTHWAATGLIAIYGEACKCWDKDKNFFYLSGGGGHLMNRATLSKFNIAAKGADDNHDTCSTADVAFGQIAQRGGIPQIHFSLFHSQGIGFYQDDPKKAISYHYIAPEKMKETYEAMTL